ncbi:MAG: patatin family protein [Lachnospiraceae bacterium]|nr:patatin family protein [Lachnospiraceae bacterium]
MKTGLVLEGGALRGLFTAGALDFLLDEKIEFDYIAGVSAGAGNLMNYISGQRGRTKKVISPGKKDAYYGLGQLLKTGSYLNLQKMIFEFSYHQFPYDFDAHRNTQVEHEIVVVNCNTAEAEYINGAGEDEHTLTAVKASCSVPLLSVPVEMDGNAYMDGSLVDSIPYQHAFDQGCDKVVIIMTKTGTEIPTDYNKYKLLIQAAYGKQYPKFADALLHRADVYQTQKEEMERLAEEGKIFILRPHMPCISKFETREDKREAFYQHGFQRMQEEYGTLREFMELR